MLNCTSGKVTSGDAEAFLVVQSFALLRETETSPWTNKITGKRGAQTNSSLITHFFLFSFVLSLKLKTFRVEFVSSGDERREIKIKNLEREFINCFFFFYLLLSGRASRVTRGGKISI